MLQFSFPLTYSFCYWALYENSLLSFFYSKSGPNSTPYTVTPINKIRWGFFLSLGPKNKIISSYSKSERTAGNYRYSFKSLLTENYMDSIQSFPSFIITTLIFSHNTSVYTCQRHNCNILLNREKHISIGEVVIWYL